MNNPPCKICKRKKTTNLFGKVFNGTTYQYFRCLFCSVIFIHPTPILPKHAYSYKNPSTHIQDKYTQVSLLFKIPFGKTLFNLYTNYPFQNRYRTVLKYKKTGSILDIGCGEGSFLQYFDKHKWDVHGIELNKHLAKQTKQKIPHAKIVSKKIEEFKTTQKFDVITMWHVLEHIEEPLSILQKIKKLLKPHGIIIIETPHANSMHMKLFKSYWQSLLVPLHLFFWDKKSFTYTLKKVGFANVKTKYAGIFSFCGASSFINVLKSKSMPTFIALCMGFMVFPLMILLQMLFAKNRDNISIHVFSS